jgi:polyhydroxyalkanoate synthase
MSAEETETANPPEVIGAGETAALPSLPSLFGALRATLWHADTVGRLGGLGAELAKVALGRSDVSPARSDWRFKDPTWSENPVYRRLAQSYVATCAAVEDAVQSGSDDGRAKEQAQFLLGIVTSAMAPTNTLAGNPAALKRALETGGTSLVRGVNNFVRDARHNGGMPSTAKSGAFTVGTDLAATPGAVVDLDELAEVLQYRPQTRTVRERPVLVIPPPIGRYYFLDLRPGRSFVEYAVSRGLQTFILSWRNPSREQSAWDLDTYAARILKAIETVRSITRTEDVNVIGFCAGGILGTSVLNHLASTGDERVHAAAFAVTLMDFGQRAPIGAFSSSRLLSLARWNSRRSGVITARGMGSVFSWMRPNELVWNYWVNNYLMGQDPAPFDILSWNADGTNLPATLHSQFLDIFQRNPLVTPGGLTVLGTPIDLSTIKVPAYVVGAIADHLTPWKGCFRNTELLGGDSTFVLSNAGHIASLVNPPNNPKASYFTGELDGANDAEAWLASANQRTGSWWENWADWTLERSGPEKQAPRTLGSKANPVLGEAPGDYVRNAN